MPSPPADPAAPAASGSSKDPTLAQVATILRMMTDSPASHDFPASASSPDPEHRNIIWAFALQIVGIVVGVLAVVPAVWLVAFCSALCRELSSAGLDMALIFAPIAVPLICLIVSVLICLREMTARRHRAVWVITWSGFILVVVDFILIAG